MLALHRLDQPLNLFDKVRCDHADGLKNTLGLFRHGDRLERLFFLNLCGRLKIRLAEVVLVAPAIPTRPVDPIGGKSGGEVFRPLNFTGVLVIVNHVRRVFFADSLRAGLQSLPILLLLLVRLCVPQPARRAETHSTPASPGEVSVTHFNKPFCRCGCFATCRSRSTK